MKKIISLLIIILIIMICFVVATANAFDIKATIANWITITIDGKTLDTGYDKPIIYNNRVYVPARYIAEGLGAKVNFVDGEYTDTVQILSGIQYSTPTPTPTSIPTPIALTQENIMNLRDTTTLTDYQAKISITEIIRGDIALGYVLTWNQYNERPEDGYEYLLAKIKFNLISDNNSIGDGLYTARDFDFCLVSEGVIVKNSPIIIKHGYDMTQVYPNGTLEGWIAFLVKKNDLKPLIKFNDHFYYTKENKWFKAYAE